MKHGIRTAIAACIMTEAKIQRQHLRLQINEWIISSLCLISRPFHHLIELYALLLQMKVMMKDNTIHNKAVTVGFFDGVHTGHRHLADRLKKEAEERGMLSQIVTFTEHPRQIIQTEFNPLLLSTPQNKLAMLEQTGIDICTSLHFTGELAEMDARSFMQHVLYEELGAGCLLMGHDHRFGHDCITDFNAYRKIGENIGIEVLHSDALLYKDLPVSSSRIRKCLAEGQCDEANDMLGYIYSISGTVVHGLQNGRKMGFPTANLKPYCEYLQIPANGVYAAWATVRGHSYKAMLNIGFRPTINQTGTARTIEAHLLDFDCDIYDEELSLSFVSYIRPERRFDSMKALASQLSMDRDAVRATL